MRPIRGLLARIKQRIDQLLGLQQGPDVTIEHQGMDAPTAVGRLCKPVVLLPDVRDCAAERHHALYSLDFLQHCFFCGARQLIGDTFELLQITVAVFGKEFDSVRTKELILADGRRNRALTGPVELKARLGVVGAVAAGLKRIDAHDLVLGQPSG